MIKIDIDNHSFRDWLKLFKFRYSYIRQFNKEKIAVAVVYKTKKGYHIYMYDMTYDYNTILLLECLYGSDINKQLYAYAEGKDILFRDKFNGKSREKYDKKKTLLLNKVIDEINKNTKQVKVFEVKI